MVDALYDSLLLYDEYVKFVHLERCLIVIFKAHTLKNVVLGNIYTNLLQPQDTDIDIPLLFTQFEYEYTLQMHIDAMGITSFITNEPNVIKFEMMPLRDPKGVELKQFFKDLLRKFGFKLFIKKKRNV